MQLIKDQIKQAHGEFVYDPSMCYGIDCDDDKCNCTKEEVEEHLTKLANLI